MRKIILFILVVIQIGDLQLLNASEISQQDKLVKSLSFIYAPIFGTGYYKAGAETAFVLKLAAGNALNKIAPEYRHRFLLPITFGVRKTDFDAILENGLPDELHSISVMPGLAWDFRPSPAWVIAPSVQLGLARDFDVSTTAAIYAANLRSVGHWEINGNTLSWGNRIRAVGQHNFDLNIEQGFVLLETGLNWEFANRMSFGDQEASLGMYSQLQTFLPDIGIRGLSGERIDTKVLIHLGVSLNLGKPLRFLGFPLQRLGIALVRGDDLKAISLNLGFPLFRD
jgi:hypothetical protein